MAGQTTTMAGAGSRSRTYSHIHEDIHKDKDINVQRQQPRDGNMRPLGHDGTINCVVVADEVTTGDNISEVGWPAGQCRC